MKEVIQLVIDGGNYNLSDILTKIEREWVLCHLTDEERDTLIESARTNASRRAAWGLWPSASPRSRPRCAS